MKYTVRFLPSEKTVMIDEGKTIMEAERIAGLSFEYPCGGNGTCGKCMVTVTCGTETKQVKSCTETISSDITVDLGDFVQNRGEKVLTTSDSSNESLMTGSLSPLVKTVRVDVPEAKIGDFRSDFYRFSKALSKTDSQSFENDIEYNSVSVLSAVSEHFAKDIFSLNTVVFNKTVLDVRTDDFVPLGLAFDIGTTTIACYLCELSGEMNTYTLGQLNAQVKYGNDVISRCIFAMESGLSEISGCVNEQMNAMALEVLKSADKSADDVYAVTVVGNTCMHHIFAGISPASLVNVPYTPSVNGTMILNAADYLKTAVNKNAKLVLLPVIAGFIGADTVGAILASGFAEKEKLTLLLDIGTNGEMALGNKDRRVSCSTASGPAFEGAKITCGMRGAPGAIDHVWVENGDLVYSVIDDKKPIGICGSGLIDAVCALLSTELILPSGRFNKNIDENKSPAYRMTTIDGAKCVILASADDSQNGTPVYITQKDIREVQLAKGAIAAGIEIMCETLGVTYADINEVLIAGAFGNYMKPQSMCALKMLPPELIDKIVPIGNAAGSGARLCLFDSDALCRAKDIAETTEFIELATHEHFQSKFIAQLDL